MRGTIIGIECKKHGWINGDHCTQCASEAPKQTLHINTYEWVKRGEWEHIDPANPHLRFDSKESLIRACEDRGLYVKALMKPKSQGKGFEHKRR